MADAADVSCKRLLCAILRGAVIDLLSGLRNQRSSFRNPNVRNIFSLQAEGYIYGRASLDGISFEYACEHLGLDPSIVRRRITRLRQAVINGLQIHKGRLSTDRSIDAFLEDEPIFPGAIPRNVFRTGSPINR